MMARLGSVNSKLQTPSRQALSELVAGLPIAVYVCEAPTGAMRLWNSRAVEVWGREPTGGDTDEQFSGSFRLDTFSLSEARYRAIVEDQTDLVCRFLPDGTLTFANDAYCGFFGIRREDVIGKRYQPIVHPDDLAAVQAQAAELSPSKPVVFIENRVFRADGAVRWTQWSNRALYDQQGRLLEFQSAGRDITGCKQAGEDAA